MSLMKQYPSSYESPAEYTLFNTPCATAGAPEKLCGGGSSTGGIPRKSTGAGAMQPEQATSLCNTVFTGKND